MKAIVGALTEVPEAQRGEYEQLADGRFKLKLEGDPHPDIAAAHTQVVSFRDNNIRLLKAIGSGGTIEDALRRIEELKAIDPAEIPRLKGEIEDLKKTRGKGDVDAEARIRAAVAEAIDPLKAAVNAEKEKRETAERQLATRELEGKLRDVGAKLKVEEKAMPDFLSRGKTVFGIDGIARSGDQELYSKEKPTERMGMEEWGKGLLIDAPHLFAPSKGGGAGGGASIAGKRVITTSDPVELGRYAEQIAKGEVIVVPPGQ